MTLLAHQLRAPLSTISALAQGLARRRHRMTDDDIRDRARKIWDASRRLDELIGTIMSFTRANAGGIVPERTTFDIKAMLLRVAREQERLSGTRRCELDIEALPDRMDGDPTLIEQALCIVIANALQYSPAGSHVAIRGDRAAGEIIITVADKGMGIPAADLPLVIQPFFRGGNVRHLPGTGLGLSLAHHILMLHQGAIEIESKEGLGTRVRVTMPC